MRRFVDLHVHSTASDGSLTPAEIVELAERNHLAAVALTDHDTTDGLAGAAAASAGITVRFVSGIEVSARFTDGTLHILGLGFEANGRPVRRLAEQLLACRQERNPKMAAKLQSMGLDVTMDEWRAQAGGKVVGRLHLAGLLQRKGYVRSVGEAFDRYIGVGAPGFVDKERLAPADAIAAIHDGGGLAVLAHPPQLHCANSAQLERVVRSLRRDGLDAIEVYHPDHSPPQTRAYLDLARKLGLLVSGGSDFHGAGKPDARLGIPRVPLAAVEQLLAKLPA